MIKFKKIFPIFSSIPAAVLNEMVAVDKSNIEYKNGIQS